MSDPLGNMLETADEDPTAGMDPIAAAMYDEIYARVQAERKEGIDSGAFDRAEAMMDALEDGTLDSFADPSGSGDRPAEQPSIPIPPSLADIASQVKPLELTFEDPTLNMAFDVIQDRGEMGGKRKKPLSERAGWKDMDEKGNMPKRPRGKRGGKDAPVPGSGASQSAQFVGFEPDARLAAGGPIREGGEGEREEVDLALERVLAQAGREMGLEQGVLADAVQQSEEQQQTSTTLQQADDEGQPGGGPMEEKDPKPSNESRAEQNRRAQQVYRRRREERIKELEAQAAALEPTRRALLESYDKMRSVALLIRQEYESTKIQLSALQSTLLSLNKQGVSILTSQYNFPMDPENLKEAETMRPGPIDQADVEKAFEQLERQSKELATSRRPAE